MPARSPFLPNRATKGDIFPRSRAVSLDLMQAQSGIEAGTQRLNNLFATFAVILLVFLIVFEFTGFRLIPPERDIAAPDSAAGSAVRQLILMAFFMGGIMLCLARPQQAIQVAITCWPLLVVIGWMSLSTIWSQFPFLTARRTIVYIIYFVISAGLVIWLPPRRILLTIIFSFALVMTMDVAITVAFPKRSFTDLGLAGIHEQKNVAGVFALIAVTFIAGYIFMAKRPMLRLLAILLTLATIAFLLLTRSKNAIGFFFIMLFLGLPSLFLIHSGRRAAAFVFAGFAAMASVTLIITGALGWSLSNWFEVLTGDPTFTGRTDLWAAAVDYIAEYPVLGRGFGAHWSVPFSAHPLLTKHGWWAGNYKLTIIYNQSHNGYLDIVIQLGAIGAFLATVYVIDIFFSITRLFALSPRTWQTMAPIYLVTTAFIVILLMNFFESTLLFPTAPPGTVFLILSVLVSEWRRHEVAAHLPKAVTAPPPHLRRRA